MIKDKEYYKAINYDIIVSELDKKDGGGYFAYYKDINTIMGDGVDKESAVTDVKNAFNCYIDVALKNKDIIPEPINLLKARKINISMTGDRINSLDIYAKKLHTSRSGVLTMLTDKLVNGNINLLDNNMI